MRMKCIAMAIGVTAVMCATAGAQDDDSKALDAVAAARKAIGGKKLDAVRSLTVQAAAQRNVGNFQMTSDVELALELPDKYMKTETPNGGGMMAVNNTTGFNSDRPLKSAAPAGIGPGGAMIIRMGPSTGLGAGAGGPISSGEKPTPEQQKLIDTQLVRSSRQEITRLMLGWFAAAHPAIGVQYTYAGEAESPDGKAHVIDVKNTDGFAARLFIDQQTNLPLMVTYQGPQPRMITSGGPRERSRGTTPADVERRRQELQNQPPAMVEHALYFDDWREIDGIKFPHSLRRAMAGATAEEWTITRVKVNPKIDPKKFETAQ